ncbi:MAG: hypothetical protein CR967_05930 [Proteobacteria bacterium]|nr:MAG: hypothetical protein CR967_05930 [Pseudomonadota bacterium]
MRKILLFTFLILSLCLNLKADGEMILDSSNALQNIIQNKRIPKALVDRSIAMIVLPDVRQGGLVLGGLVGDGIMVQKAQSGWTKPVYASIRGGSVGLQIGYQKSDMVFFILSSKVLEDMLSQKLTLGIDATATAWNYGENYVNMTDFKFTSDIYVFAENKGFFAGLSLGGGVMSVDKNQVSSTSYAQERWQGVLDMLNK